MIVYLEPVTGTAKANLERARHEMERVLAFRGSISEVKVEGDKIIVKVEVNPQWDLPEEQRVSYLKDWIPAKVRSSFEVVSVAA